MHVQCVCGCARAPLPSLLLFSLFCIKTGGSKGYAFIEFEDRDVASIVAETMNNYLMFDKLLKCKDITSSFCLVLSLLL